jgi:hypothetical protein
MNPKKKSFTADKVAKSYICNIDLHKFGKSQLTWKFSTDGSTPPEKKTNLPQIFTSTMKLTRKRKGQAPAMSATNAASIPGTNAGSVSAITFAPNDAMTEVMATTTSGTDTTSVPGTDAVSISNTINLTANNSADTASFHDNDTRSVEQEVATGNVSSIEPVAGEATKNIESTVTTRNDTNIILDNDATSNPNVKGTATTSSGGITDVVTGPVVANKTPGDEGVVNVVVQVSV